MPKETPKDNGPVKKFKAGNIEISLWENENKETGRVSLNASLRKSWKKDGKWEEQKMSLFRDEVSDAIPVLKKAFEYMTFEWKPPKQEDD